MAENLIPPEDHIKNFEKGVVNGDIAAMGQALGELHERWDSLSAPMRADILKLDAIFLSMLNARVKRNPSES